MPDTSAPPTQSVPFLDLVAQHAPFEDEIVAALRRIIKSAGFVGGPEVGAFEREFASYVGCTDSVAVNSGTDALRFAYMAMGVSPGDEVITVPNTFIATTEAITQAGGRIRFVDVSDDTCTMDPALVEAAITDRTVGIVPVHLFGQPADMDPILAIARRRGLWVIEDAAQAHGARYRGRPAGAIGDLAGFSFYPGKNLGACGEGGAVSGSDASRLSMVRQLRDHGQSRKYYHDVEGYNGRLDAMQCAILRIKLRHLEDWTERRRAVAAMYREGLDGVGDIRLPTEADYARHVYHLFVIRTAERDRLAAHLGERAIGTGLHYPLPLHLQRAYEGLGYAQGAFPVTEAAASAGLSLPMYAELTEGQVSYVVDNIRAFFGR